jgi:Family of unknown function (DUF6069)
MYDTATIAAVPAAYETTTPTRHTRTADAGNYSVGIDQVRYWVGATITAVIAALLGAVGLVLAHGIMHVSVLAGANNPMNAAHYGLAVAGVTLAAAGLYLGMLHVAPRPTVYYSWLAAMATVLLTLLPFTTSTGLHSELVFAAMNLAVGAAITVLVPMAAVNAQRD